MKKLLTGVLIVLIFVSLTIKDTEAGEDSLHKARKQRVEACLQAYEDMSGVPQSAVNNYKHTEQNIISRCATYATLVYAFESNYGQSTHCKEKYNCYGLQSGTARYEGDRIIKFKSYEEADLFFATKYMRWHANKNAKTFIWGFWNNKTNNWHYGWCTGNREPYVNFINKNYWSVYNNIDSGYDYSNIYNK